VDEWGRQTRSDEPSGGAEIRHLHVEEAERSASYSSAEDWYETERLTGHITGGARALSPPSAATEPVGLGWRHAELVAPPSPWERLVDKLGQPRKHGQGLRGLVVGSGTDTVDERPPPAAARQHRAWGSVRRWAPLSGFMVVVIAIAGVVVLSGSAGKAARPSASRLAIASVTTVNTVAENVIGAGHTVVHHVRASQGPHRMASEHRRPARSKPHRARSANEVSPISIDYQTAPAFRSPSVVTQPARPVYRAQPASYTSESRSSASGKEARAAGPTGQGALLGPASCGC
jgi:hypothetical protein